MSVNEVKLKQATEAFKIEGKGPDSSRTFAIGDEDHTLGNSLRHVLLQDQRTEFAAYSVPHPSEPLVKIRVQAQEGTPATEVFQTGCRTLHDQCGIVLEKLEALFPNVREDRLKIEKFIMEQEYEEMDEDED